MEAERPISRKSKTNLYERHVIGSKDILPKMPETECLKRFMHNDVGDRKTTKANKYLAKLSNCCQKLGLGTAESEYTLFLFKKGIHEKHARKWPLVAVWAIYKTCQMYGTAISNEEIKMAVKFEFSRQFLPDMGKILYRMMDIEVPEGKNLEIYHFRLMIRRILGGKEYSEEEYSKNMSMAWKLFTHCYTEGSFRSRARKSISQAFGVGK